MRLTEQLALERIRPSIGTVGDAYDNALMESINGRTKPSASAPPSSTTACDKNIADVEYATAGWVDWYNNRRFHSTLGNVTRRVRASPLRWPSTESRTPYRNGREPGALQNARYRRAVRARGHFPNEQAAMKCLYLVTKSLDPKGTGKTRWAVRWKPAMNAFAVTFADRMPTKDN